MANVFTSATVFELFLSGVSQIESVIKLSARQ